MHLVGKRDLGGSGGDSVWLGSNKGGGFEEKYLGTTGLHEAEFSTFMQTNVWTE